MPDWTRRDLLKAGLAASAGAVANPALSLSKANDNIPEKPVMSLPADLQISSPRERLLLDFGWRFHLGHASDPQSDFGYGARRRESAFAKSGNFLPVTGLMFDDSSWTSIDLPHDWAVELPFKNDPLLPHHGAKPLGREYPETSIGWYRRSFDLPASDAGKRIVVDFDGVFRHAVVMLNGHYIGENFSGYAPFSFDLTDFANIGNKNVLAVRVDATLGEGWFYEGAGIYRHVWLSKTAPLHVVQWGNFARSEVRGSSAVISISTEVENQSDAQRTGRVISRIVDPKNSRWICLDWLRLSR